MSGVLASPIRASRRESMVLGHAANTTSVKVVVRIRPPDSAAAKLGARFQKVVVQPRDQQTIQIEAPVAIASTQATPSKNASVGNKALFTFDRVIGPEEGQGAVYDQAGPLVDAFLDGFNVTILAYGQTSSGKSYTMGTDRTFEALHSPDWNEDRLGITPRAINEIFERMNDMSKHSKGKVTFKVKLSYVEIYNEDLIDLLAGEREARATVQIREDVKGNIIWSGLKEVTVNSAAEVMNHLTAGSSIRQTGATDMNAQSSRSHAIFSLTLEQRKSSGSARPTSPSPPHTRLPSRASMLPRVSSPTPGSRSSTPTQDRPGSRIGLGLGLRTPGSASQPMSPEEERTERWTTLTSKFHFVDLAGSERLKRTAAAGERVKEGISINSGLHALGNVISALGDPTKKSTHVPYRDSKLTRLLQDSLGGNARTMMIACISATELNVNETLSTVKYANRARNIKNRAEINEMEVGWDDVEYLQRTVTKLRAELAGLRNGDASVINRISEEGEEREGASLRDQFNELQQRYAQQTADLAAVQTSMSGISPSSMSRSDFAAAIEPVVEEYEKSLSALEGQLSLTKAALAHSEEELREWESRFDEERQSRETHEVLIDTLKARNSKLSERELTTELYIRDLEQRLKETETDDARGSEVSDMKREINKARDERERLEAHIADIEARLSKADENNATLKRQIDVLERDIQRREEAYRGLESRLSVLDSSGDHKMLVQAIEEKDKKLLDLERSVDELKSRSDLAEQEKGRLEKLMAAEAEAKRELNNRVKDLERASVVTSSEALARAKAGPNGTDNSNADDTKSDVVVSALEHQLYKLQQTHEATLAQLESLNTKYRDSLKEIDELNSMVSDSHDGRFDRVRQDASPKIDRSDVDDDIDEDTPPTKDTNITPPRRTPRARRSVPLAPSHRLSFLGRGQGAPTQTHVRSASLSQELSLAVSSQASSPPSPRLSSPSASSITRESIYGTLISTTGDRSYDQMKMEVIKLQAALREREDELREMHSSLRRARGEKPSANGSPTKSRITKSSASTPPDPFGEPILSPKTKAAFDAIKIDDPFSSGRLEDLMRAMAQKESGHRDVVDKLEAELSDLRRQHEELTILSRDQVNNMSTEIDQLRSELDQRPDVSNFERQISSLKDELEAKAHELREAQESAEEQILVATTKLASEHQRATEDNAATMLRMKEDHTSALKKALQGKEDLLKQLLDEHTVAFDAQAADFDKALQQKVDEHEQALSHKAAEFEKQLQERSQRHAQELESECQKLNEQRQAELASAKADHEKFSDSLREAHAAEVKSLQAEVDSSRALHAQAQHDIASLKTQHEEALRAKALEHDIILTGLKESHGAELDTIRANLAIAKEDHGRAQEALSALEDEHATAVEAARLDHGTVVQELQDKHAAELEALRTELTTARKAHEQSQDEIAAVKDEHDKAVQVLNETHSTELESLRTDLSTTKQAHAQTQAEMDSVITEHDSALHSLREEHDNALRMLREAHAAELEHLQTELAASKDAHAALQQELETLKAGHNETVRGLRSDYDSAFSVLRDSHVAELAVVKALLSSAKEEHARNIEAAQGENSRALEDKEQAHKAETDRLQAEHEDRIDALLQEHKAAQQKLRDELGAATTQQEETQAELDKLRLEHEQAVREHKDVLVSQKEELASRYKNEADSVQARHDDELNALREEHATNLEKLRAENEKMLEYDKANLVSQYEDELIRIKAEHEETLAGLKSEHDNVLKTEADKARAETESLMSGHKAALRDKDETARSQQAEMAERHQKELAQVRIELEQAMESQAQQHAAVLAQLREEHEQAVSELKEESSSAVQTLQSTTEDHESAMAGLKREFEDQSSTARDAHNQALQQLEREHEGSLERLRQEHSADLAAAKEAHESIIATRGSELKAATDRHASELEDLRSSLTQKNKEVLETIHTEHESALRAAEESSAARTQELSAAHESALRELAAEHDQELQSREERHQTALEELKRASLVLLFNAHEAANVKLREGLEAEHDKASALLSQEISTLRGSLTKVEAELVQVRSERDAIQAQTKQLSAAQRSAPSVINSLNPGVIGLDGDRALSPTSESNRLSLQRKAPPPTPPPSMPPPPLPTSLPPVPNGTPVRGIVRSPSTSSINRQSLGGSDSVFNTSRPDSVSVESRLMKRLDEQDAMIARLSKQLTHCESDLQANIDLVNTLESALNDSERNLRKARTQMNELAKERDLFVHQNEQLRQQVKDAHVEVESVRHSVIDAETRLQEEKFGKESRARELERRLDEANRARKSKFNCF
ncbi:hypothetical protein OIV83_001476 [Microbotryomycetes sp. JL201]|nr:hypothetical protein OIV83_001476 [Microbotryomycetes sp. JL201]